jgi:hypothetical protein
VIERGESLCVIERERERERERIPLLDIHTKPSQNKYGRMHHRIFLVKIFIFIP